MNRGDNREGVLSIPFLFGNTFLKTPKPPHSYLLCSFFSIVPLPKSQVKQLGFWLNSWKWRSLLLFSSKGFILLEEKKEKKKCISDTVLSIYTYLMNWVMVNLWVKGAFERRRYMNLVVQRARHPQLRDYIHSAVFGLLPFIQKGMVERAAVIFFNTDSIPVERFVFKLAVNLSYGSKVEEADLEFSLRSFLIKLSVSESLTKVLPRNYRWEITAYFRSLPEASANKDVEQWIPTDTRQWEQPPLLTPIKSMSSEPLCVQLYIEHPSLSEPKPQNGEV